MMKSRTVVSLLIQLHPSPTGIALRPLAFHSTSTLGTRCYATHKERPHVKVNSSSLNGQTPKSAFDGQESVGPFPLGVGPSGRAKEWPKWRELNLGGKLGRTVKQTGNLGVIIFGAGLFALLTISLTTELFASNSPGVLYSQAVDKIRASDALNPHLLPPLSFTHTPHAAAPVRGTTPIAHRTVRHPGSGRDHLLITFYVHGRGKDEPEPLHWAKDSWAYVEKYAREAGEWAGVLEPVAEVPIAKVEAPAAPISEGSGWVSKMFGGWTGLRTTPETSAPVRGRPPPGTYKVGEVHGDYVKNASGTYQLLSLIVDVPASSASYPGRAEVYWSPEADREGLLGRR